MFPRLIFNFDISSEAISAPSSSALARSASDFGANWLLVRPSGRSFSNWVGVCVFGSLGLARRFASWAAEWVGIPFCIIRRIRGGYGVSVPLSVTKLPECPYASLPCCWFDLGGLK